MKRALQKVVGLTTACVIALGTATSASACTTLAVGKDASDTGSVLVSQPVMAGMTTASKS